MIYTYSEIKIEYASRNQLFREVFYNFFELFEEIYDKDAIKFIYLRNLFNSDEVETIIFFENKLVKITRNDSHYIFKDYNYKSVQKELVVSQGSEREVILKIIFDDKVELVFNSLKDSNKDWCWDYGQDIKELFRML